MPPSGIGTKNSSSCVLRSVRVRNRIVDACFLKSPQPQCATIADAAGNIGIAIARPRQMKWCAKIDPFANNLMLGKVNQRRFDGDIARWAGPCPDHPIESLIVLRPAVRVSGTILPDCADENPGRS